MPIDSDILLLLDLGSWCFSMKEREAEGNALVFFFFYHAETPCSFHQDTLNHHNPKHPSKLSRNDA